MFKPRAKRKDKTRKKKLHIQYIILKRTKSIVYGKKKIFLNLKNYKSFI